MREVLFVPRADNEHPERSPASVRGTESKDAAARYLAFAPAVTDKAAIKTLIEAAPGVTASHAAIHAALDAWWADNVRLIEALPGGNVYSLRRRFMQSIAATVTPYGLLAVHTVRGAMASYFKTLEADFKSIAASGWNAELIPDDEILASQFPAVLAAQAERQARIAELGALFAAADEAEDEAEVEAEDDTAAGGVLPSAAARQLREENGEDRARLKELLDQMRGQAGELFDAGQRAGLVGTRERRTEYTTGLNLRAPDLASYDRLLALHERSALVVSRVLDVGRHARAEAERLIEAIMVARGTADRAPGAGGRAAPAQGGGAERGAAAGRAGGPGASEDRGARGPAADPGAAAVDAAGRL